ncbi:sulfur oxidation c-type cytochrome SoxX [Alsobacter sp. SYSU BS001988]
MRATFAALCVGAALGAPATASDRIDAPLDGLSGDPARGKAIVLNRRKGLCLLCHSGPFPEQPSQGDLAPDLSGVGARLDPAQLRLRIVDSRRLDPASIMPAYRRTEGLARVAAPYRGKPILAAQEVEDVVAFLSTLR